MARLVLIQIGTFGYVLSKREQEERDDQRIYMLEVSQHYISIQKLLHFVVWEVWYHLREFIMKLGNRSWSARVKVQTMWQALC